VHLRDDGVVIDWGGILEKRGTVDVKCRTGESILRIPVITSRLTGYKVDGLYGMVKKGEVYLTIGVSGELVLGLCKEKFVFVVGEEFALISV
tara:strand:- start:25 stop:300 length:276 start_codon:yes stop_codon:yes gene_type:complete